MNPHDPNQQHVQPPHVQPPAVDAYGQPVEFYEEVPGQGGEIENDATKAPDGDSSRFWSAVGVAVIVHLLLLMIAWFIKLGLDFRKDPEIVAEVVAPTIRNQPKIEKRAVAKQAKSTSASASSPLARMLRANATAQIAVPEVKKVSRSPIGLGQGDLGNGFGAGSGGSGMGSGATFFGRKAAGNKFVFCLDISQSMNPGQLKLLRTEFAKSAKALQPGIQYQVVCFAGPAWVLGSKVSGNKNNPTVSMSGKKWEFKSVGGALDFSYVGSQNTMQKPAWLGVNGSSIAKTVKDLNSVNTVYGTDWGLALDMCLIMDPVPNSIYLMSDGACKIDSAKYAKALKSKGVILHGFSMDSSRGDKDFKALAKGTGGTYTKVQSNGKVQKVNLN